MKRITFITIAIGVLFCGCDNKNNTAPVLGKDIAVTIPAKDELAAVRPDAAAMMKNWQEYMSPGAFHVMMASWDGNWTGAVTTWMSPDAPPEKTTLAVSHRMLLGGRYQVATHKGTMMGMPFEGISTTGYDNAKKKFINTWIDNSGTGVLYLEGIWDDKSETITYTGKCVASEMGDGSETGVKQVLKIIGATRQELLMYLIAADGTETKTMEIVYTKK